MKTPIPYYGGKQEMVNDILPLIPKHHVYVEPFAGGASIFFAKTLANINVLNDTNNHVVNFWKVMQSDFIMLNRMIQTTVHSRTLADYAKKLLKSMDSTDLQRAWAFYYSVITGFSNTLDGGFPVAITADRNSKLLQLKSKKKFFLLGKFLINNATIENLDAIKCIQKYDSDRAFFYSDPPYIGCNQGHYAGWTQDDLFRLLNCLQRTEGKFMLSEFRNPIVVNWALAHGYNISTFEKVARASTIQKGKPRESKFELLIMNYHSDGTKIPGNPEIEYSTTGHQAIFKI